ncbi:Uncharacterized conserved protein YjbJ, UPF0337 family [Prosthecobacter debontii]|uniref:Uncharacterized conserved protein YjbJ, UPF0337 family n=1 Tax=Prosthecobacter debontii TaxID=48467 RepID=A0A1T4X093_9BACT|nr:CsbD family protein [Prosthecobacter debontii]SKA82281.1 Uncharacterized conserved protein YjbJ, UPF0337 family [Prosthecobacter debontii]
MKTIIPIFIVSLALVSCDRQERAEIQEDARELAKDVKESATELTKEVKDATNYEANKLKLKGTWHETKGKLKQKYAELTEDDLLYEEGKEDELYGRLQKRLGKSREEVEKIIEEQ